MIYGNSATKSKFEATALYVHGLDHCQQQIILETWDDVLAEVVVFCYPFPTIYLNLLPPTLWDHAVFTEIILLSIFFPWNSAASASGNLWGKYQIRAKTLHTLPSCFVKSFQSRESLFPWGAWAYIYQRPGTGSLGLSEEPSNFHRTLSGWVGFVSAIRIVPAHPHFPSFCLPQIALSCCPTPSLCCPSLSTL